MKTLTIKTYSEKGLVVKGASKKQAEEIRSKLGRNVCTQFNAKLGGWTFSRKREDKIKAIIASMTDDLPGKWGVLAESEKEPEYNGFKKVGAFLIPTVVENQSAP